MVDAITSLSQAERPCRQSILGFRLNEITRRRINNFKSNRRGFFSLWIFLFFFSCTLFAEVIANDKPLVLKFSEKLYFPTFLTYPETAFGGEFETEADYRDEYVAELINENGWMLWPS